MRHKLTFYQYSYQRERTPHVRVLLLTGFTLIEILVVLGIIGILATIIFAALGGTRDRAYDARRKTEITQLGRLLSANCYIPNAGAGVYDFAPLVEELKIKYPQYANFLKKTPRDPRTGTETEAFYRYEVTPDGEDCIIYANLDNEDEPITLPTLVTPTPGGGTGVLEAESSGWNGTRVYFQVSN